MRTTNSKAVLLAGAGALLVIGAPACSHDEGLPKGPSSAAGATLPPAAGTGSAAAGKGPVVYDRNGKLVDCAPNTSTPANPATCPPEAPDTAFTKACEAAHFKTVICGNCWVTCSGRVSP